MAESMKNQSVSALEIQNQVLPVPQVSMSCSRGERFVINLKVSLSEEGLFRVAKIILYGKMSFSQNSTLSTVQMPSLALTNDLVVKWTCHTNIQSFKVDFKRARSLLVELFLMVLVR